MEFTERQRQSIINEVFELSRDIDRLGGQLGKVELKDLPELLSKLDERTALFLTQLRVYTT